MPRYFFTPADSAAFQTGRHVKLDVARGEQLFVGLNCFEPGQSQAIHAHAGADKFYLILSGNASMLVGDEERDAGSGTLVWAPAGVPHGVTIAKERTVMLIAIAPAP